MKEHLYTVQPSLIEDAGVGCFAMSDIPSGSQLTTDTPNNNRRLREEDIPDVYLKYCPLLESGLYLAPANFCVMSVFWYINHARQPNTDMESWRLYAARDLEAGEEVTMYYPDLLTHPKNKLWVKPEHV